MLAAPASNEALPLKPGRRRADTGEAHFALYYPLRPHPPSPRAISPSGSPLRRASAFPTVVSEPVDENAPVDRKAMTALSSGHLVTDLAQGALPAFLPFLVDKFELSYTMAAALVLAGTFASSIIQPLFGLWSDARGALWLLPAGVAIAGVGMASAAVVPSYGLVVLAVIVSGLGVAAYHPEGSKFASYVSGGRRASGMAFFSVGGNIGFALGPLVASFAILTLGLGLEDGGVLIAIPGLVVGVALLFSLRYLASFAPTSETGLRREPRAQPAPRHGRAPRRRRPALGRAHGALHVRPALRDLAREERGLRDPPALRVPPRRRRRDADRRPARRPLRAPADDAHELRGRARR